MSNEKKSGEVCERCEKELKPGEVSPENKRTSGGCSTCELDKTKYEGNERCKKCIRTNTATDWFPEWSPKTKKET
jgi:hypothetical protein